MSTEEPLASDGEAVSHPNTASNRSDPSQANVLREQTKKRGSRIPFFPSGRQRKAGSGGIGSQSERNYERKYEPDERYQELGTSARVWHVYNDEADKYDTDLVEGMSGSLDVLLIFAALFAGIITAFLSQTAQKLDVDTGGVTIALLNEIIALQRATTQNGVDVSSIPRASSTSTPSTLILWVNGLWFTSLNLSIASALLSVLAKQWFHQYSAFKPGSARERAFTRQFRFDGLEKWHVPLIVGLLPSILHASLGLFLLGLFIYLVDLRPSMAISVGILSISLGIVYLITILIPLVDVQCAYRTPLTDILSNILRYYCNQSVRVRHIYRLFEQLQDSLPGPRVRRPPQGAVVWPTVRAAEHACVSPEDHKDEVEIGERAYGALCWLVDIASDDSSVKTIVRQCIGAFPYDFVHFRPDEHGTLDFRLWSIPPSSDFDQVYRAEVQKCCDSDGRPHTDEDEQRLERLLRAGNAISWSLQLLGQPLIVRDIAVAMVASVQTLSVSVEDDENNVEHVAPHPFEWYVEKCGGDITHLPHLPPEVWDSYLNLIDQLGLVVSYTPRIHAMALSMHKRANTSHARPLSFLAFLLDIERFSIKELGPAQVPLPTDEECETAVNRLTGHVEIIGEWLQDKVATIAYGFPGEIPAVHPPGYDPPEIGYAPSSLVRGRGQFWNWLWLSESSSDSSSSRGVRDRALMLSTTQEGDASNAPIGECVIEGRNVENVEGVSSRSTSMRHVSESEVVPQHGSVEMV